MKAPVTPATVYRSRDRFGPAAEHWAPCEGQLSRTGNFYVACAVFRFSNGAVLVYEVPAGFPTADAALYAAIRATSSENPDALEAPAFEEVMSVLLRKEAAGLDKTVAI